MSQSPFRLLPADISDMPDIARLEYLAFEHDALHSCAFPDRSSPEALSSRASSLSELLAMPSSRVTKVIDSENNICAVAAWTLHLSSDWANENSELSSRDIWGPRANISICEEAFGKADRMFKDLLGGKPCAKLDILIVLPKFQRKGLGEQLMKDGLVEVDRAQLPACLGATSSGHGLYLKMGFRDVKSAEYDLSSYGGKGIVAYTAMVRPASQ